MIYSSASKLLLVFCCLGCSSPNVAVNEDESDRPSESTYSEIKSPIYEDDEYCATIDYYNPDTGTRSTYTLTVLIEDGELVQINWPNGGWLDDSHFSPEELDEEGSCSFTTFEGREYSVQIESEGSCNYSSPSIINEQAEEEIYIEEESEEVGETEEQIVEEETEY